MTTEVVKIGVIGGSGLYNMPEITNKTTISIDTPFGKPSGDIVVGTLNGKRVAFLSRHGEGHIYTPTTVPYRANIYAMKTLGVRFIISANACGSLREDYEPGHIVIPDQLYDNTKDRERTFFDTGMVAHISVADPFCPELNDILYKAVQETNASVHLGGNFVIIEGPRFSTRGESNIFRQWGCSIIGMTTCPEAFLAREAEIAYSTIAHITDYDVWHKEPVTVAMVIKTMQNNVRIVQQSIANAVKKLDENAVSEAHNALDNAILTSAGKITFEMKDKLLPIVERYFADQING